MTTLDRWDKRFIGLSQQVATWSKDPSTKVGCILVSDKQIIGTGYNGLPPGIDLPDAAMLDRTYKLLHTNHAEANVIAMCAKRGIATDRSTIYVTHACCSTCAKLLIRAGIRRVVYAQDLPDSWVHEQHAAISMLKISGVLVSKYQHSKE